MNTLSLHSIALACLLFGIVTTSAQAEKAYDVVRFGKLLKTNKYDAAWTYIKDIESDNDGDLYFQKGTLLGSGLLSQGIDKCAAVFNFEKALQLKDSYVIGSLDFLYGGDWAGIAALEGNARALVEVGYRLSISKVQSNIFAGVDKTRPAKDAYSYYHHAFKLGSKLAKKRDETSSRGSSGHRFRQPHKAHKVPDYYLQSQALK